MVRWVGDIFSHTPGQPLLRSVRHLHLAATGLHENKAVAVVGGRIAKQARQQLEQQTSRSVITSDNYLAPASKSVITKTKKKTVKKSA
jgi:hypothetical protein